jgi:hypothetical protein
MRNVRRPGDELDELVAVVVEEVEAVFEAEPEPHAANVTASAATGSRRRPTFRQLRGILRSIRRVGQGDDVDALGTDTPYRVAVGPKCYVLYIP